MPTIVKNYYNILSRLQRLRAHASVGCGSVGQSQAAWKLINIHILKLWLSAHWSAAADER